MNDQQNWNKKIEELMLKDEQAFIHNLEGIRSNRISVDYLKNIIVNSSEQKVKLVQLASLRTSSARDLTISAYNKKDVVAITKAFLAAELGYKLERTQNETMYFSLLPLTEEIRTKLIKKSKEMLEHAKIALRNSRQKVLNEVKNAKSFSSDQEKKIKKSIEDTVSLWTVKLTKIHAQKVTELSSF